MMGWHGVNLSDSGEEDVGFSECIVILTVPQNMASSLTSYGLLSSQDGLCSLEFVTQSISLITAQTGTKYKP